ncbi:M56 family peptidase [Nodosilinea sp. PGN35]|uniref:M56 family peptidase n=1 Tax=Nodosilinea sp. PGN35 TaxID=3020489 RepID=UPI0023B23B75|nr:M56 family peptidase [Nodosilinea sp. TSF1-S3]MDF0365893.1 M56 family peptidase [Nodosilinea sp. TSF1-S3]
MHISLLALMVGVAVLWRWRWQPTAGSWQTRWQTALSAFCLPPLMVLLAAGVVIAMGHHGTMMGRSVSPVGCWVSLGVLTIASGVLAYSLGRAAGMAWWLRQYPLVPLPQGGQGRCLPMELPIIAQIGLGRSALVVSQGWLQQLTPTEQQATIAHEQAHADCRDPFWFFWLGVLRRLGGWLPNTTALWEELLLLRELRADQRAAQTSDPLLLAELLVKLARQMTLAQPMTALDACVGFNEAMSLSRLEQRVNALIEPGEVDSRPRVEPGQILWLAIALLPLATPWLHR